jgi:hypothetical protein
MQELIARSTWLVVMAEGGRQMLEDVYRAPSTKLDLILHGIPDIPFVDPNYCKDEFDVEGRVVLLTFGLLSPHRGIEHALNALPHFLETSDFLHFKFITLNGPAVENKSMELFPRKIKALYAMLGR